jgi:hypothetical protein
LARTRACTASAWHRAIVRVFLGARSRVTRETGATSPVHFVRALCLAEDAPSSVAGLVTSFETA